MDETIRCDFCHTPVELTLDLEFVPEEHEGPSGILASDRSSAAIRDGGEA